MKKIISSFVLALSVIIAGTASAQNPIGLLMEGYENDCKVNRGSNKIDCKYLMELFENDIIIKSPDLNRLKVQWLYPPHTKSEQLNKTTLKVLYNPPYNMGILGTSKEILLLLRDVLPFVKESAKVSTPVVSRSSLIHNIDLRLLPQPGYNSTAIARYSVTFYWGFEGANYIFFNNSQGSKVYEHNIKGKLYVDLTPEEIGFKKNEVYTWDIEGVTLGGPYSIKLLDDKITNQIEIGIKEIENMQISREDMLIYKALYLQMVSDLFPKDVDLYWLSYKMIKSMDDTLSRELKRRYLLHLNSEFIKR